MNYKHYYDFNGDVSIGIMLIDDEGVQVATIPPCPGNRFWDAYQLWLDDGNEALPADPLPE